MRVGIDSASKSGKWNAPVNTNTNRFVFVPIPDSSYNTSGDYIPQGMLTYRSEKVLDLLQGFGTECGAEVNKKYFTLPSGLSDVAMHLDPDFEKLTYGDGRKRGRKLCAEDDGTPVDLLVFYAGLRSVQNGNILCALVGMLDIKWPTFSPKQLAADRLCNAHTRWMCNKKDDVIARSKEGARYSGLFSKCIPIGRYRDGAHRVDLDILKLWGGLRSRNGYIQRSGTLYDFEDAEKFKVWLDDQLEKHEIKIEAVRYQVPQIQ